MKRRFLQELKEALKGNVSEPVLAESISYYDGYFNDEIKKGKSEQQVYDDLGPARIIAKTIIDTKGSAASGTYYYDEGTEGQYYSSSYDKTYGYDDEETRKGWHINIDQNTGHTSLAFGRLDFSTVLGKIVIALCVLAVLVVVGMIIYLGIRVLLYVVLPIAVIILIINVFISIFGNRS